MAAKAVYLEIDESRRDDRVISPQAFEVSVVLGFSWTDPRDEAVFDQNRA